MSTTATTTKRPTSRIKFDMRQGSNRVIRGGDLDFGEPGDAAKCRVMGSAGDPDMYVAFVTTVARYPDISHARPESGWFKEARIGLDKLMAVQRLMDASGRLEFTPNATAHLMRYVAEAMDIDWGHADADMQRFVAGVAVYVGLAVWGRNIDGDILIGAADHLPLSVPEAWRPPSAAEIAERERRERVASREKAAAILDEYKVSDIAVDNHAEAMKLERYMAGIDRDELEDYVWQAKGRTARLRRAMESVYEALGFDGFTEPEDSAAILLKSTLDVVLAECYDLEEI